MTLRILVGDARERLLELPADSVHSVVTSPPYYGLRDYGVAGQIGLEPSPAEYVETLVAVFREVRRVLRKDGTLWLNLGDSYNAHPGQRKTTDKVGAKQETNNGSNTIGSRYVIGTKPKDLIGIPWMVAFALRADGWWLRQDIIWSKPNPMPESVTDRCTKAHEYLFLLSKSARYWFDQAAIAEPSTISTIARLSQPTLADQRGSDRVPGKTNGPMKAVGRGLGAKGQQTPDEVRSSAGARMGRGAGWRDDPANVPITRNRRSVWTVPTQPYAEAHFATFPPALVEPCILAGCPKGGTVLDPFFGAGTTGIVADRLGRHCIGIELNPAYAEMTRARLVDDAGMFANVEFAA